MNDDTVKRFPILKFFAFAHLPSGLQEISRPFCHLAYAVAERIDDNSPRESCIETSVAIRKLLEAKDAAVRAAL